MIALLGACTPSAKSGPPAESAEVEPPTPEPPTPTPETPPPVSPTEHPRSVETAHIAVSREQAVAAGLPALGFALDTTGTGMSGFELGDGAYLQLSGPPGGPMLLKLSPATVGAELREVIAGGELAKVIEGPLLDDQVTLLGEVRPAVAWITGESLARTSWCAVLLAPKAAAPDSPALLLEVGTGHQGDAIVCATVVEDPAFAAMLATLELH